jgi:hypothetical protein
MQAASSMPGKKGASTEQDRRRRSYRRFSTELAPMGSVKSRWIIMGGRLAVRITRLGEQS